MAILTLLLQGCASTCEEWEVRPVTRQVCGRWVGSNCASYNTQLSQERVCKRQKTSAQPERPAAVSSAPKPASALAPAVQRPGPADIGLPDLGPLQRALFERIRSPGIAYAGVTRRVLWRSELNIFGTPQMKALINAEARGGELAWREPVANVRQRFHSLRLTVVRMRRAEAAREYIDLQRKEYAGPGRIKPLQLASPAGVAAHAHDIVSAAGAPPNHGRHLALAKGPYLAILYEGRVLPRGMSTDQFEPARPFDAESVLQQIASALPAQ